MTDSNNCLECDAEINVLDSRCEDCQGHRDLASFVEAKPDQERNSYASVARLFRDDRAISYSIVSD